MNAQVSGLHKSSSLTHGSIARVGYALPDRLLSNADLSSLFRDYDFAKLSAKTGITSRHVASENELSSDLAFLAVTKTFKHHISLLHSVDYFLLCTQSPDKILPSTACILQDRLGIPRSAGALDINMGCSGYPYCLGIAEGLIATRQAQRILLVTVDKITQYLAFQDYQNRALFGDAASATLIEASGQESIGPFVYGTDGRGKNSLVVHGQKYDRRPTPLPGYSQIQYDYNMDGQKVFAFAVQEVPRAVKRLLDVAQLSESDIALFVFHQANRYLLEEIYRILAIPSHKQYFALSDCGNTGSSSIPIALYHAALEGVIAHGDQVMIVGFGVGFSWSGTIIRWGNFADD